MGDTGEHILELIESTREGVGREPSLKNSNVLVPENHQGYIENPSVCFLASKGNRKARSY